MHQVKLIKTECIPVSREGLSNKAGSCVRPSTATPAGQVQTCVMYAQVVFGECPLFCKKVVLTRRIKWFEDSDGQPSFNHAWYIWAAHSGKPTLAYGP